MGCEEIRDLLALYAGGESYDSERAAVEAHVAICAACARELDQSRGRLLVWHQHHPRPEPDRRPGPRRQPLPPGLGR